jgi:hypothetical protein
MDAHYSQGFTSGRGTDASILKELAGLTPRNQAKDLILIDDARLFGWEFGCPKLKVIQQYAAGHWPKHSFRVETDVICIMRSS